MRGKLIKSLAPSQISDEADRKNVADARVYKKDNYTADTVILKCDESQECGLQLKKGEATSCMNEQEILDEWTSWEWWAWTKS